MAEGEGDPSAGTGYCANSLGGILAFISVALRPFLAVVAVAAGGYSQGCWRRVWTNGGLTAFLCEVTVCKTKLNKRENHRKKFFLQLVDVQDI